MSDFHMDGGPIGLASVLRIQPLTQEAKDWVEEHVSQDGFQPDWPTLYVEHRYLDNLIGGIAIAGLTVDAIEHALVE